MRRPSKRRIKRSYKYLRRYCKGRNLSDGGAGIGSGPIDKKADLIKIYGGNVTALGGSYAAGIGGGNGGESPEITIYGGNIYASGGKSEATGIGLGSASAEKQKGGDIKIYGGNITAKGLGVSAGIGGGSKAKFDKTITISGGTVNASSEMGVGIGGGFGEKYELYDQYKRRYGHLGRYRREQRRSRLRR